ncbi:MAG: Gfo/Idh/MocA family protein [Hyphomicrobiaceae bacterium]
MTRIGWGLVGGGRGSQIGPAHRIGAGLDGAFAFAAGALDHRPEESRIFGRELGLGDDRAYGDWEEMLAGERSRDDRVKLVTVATPNATHFNISKAFLEAGFHVLVEKPMTANVDEAEDLFRVAQASGRICAVNYGYSGYPLVRHMKAMVRRGDLGKVRLVFAEFAHGHHADASTDGNPRVRWRYDPDQAGISAVFADVGIHALHLATFVCGEPATQLSADFAYCLPSRALEDDAMVNFRTETGAVGRLWASAVAVGRQHGLTLQVFGEKGGMRWSQEHPDQLYWMSTGKRIEIIERGESNLSAEADQATRITIGHAEGFPFAVANIYADLAEAIRARTANRPANPARSLYPTVVDGLRSAAAIQACVESARGGGCWVDARPSLLR